MTIKALLPEDWNNKTDMERTAWLENVSDKIERGKMVNKPLSPEEVTDLRDDLESVSTKLYDLQDKYSDIKKEYNAEIKELKETVKTVVNALRYNYKRIESDTYHIRDYDNGMLYELAPDGSKVSERRLTPDEMQSTVHGAQREATNNN